MEGVVSEDVLRKYCYRYLDDMFEYLKISSGYLE
jgi:hypothetical protein